MADGHEKAEVIIYKDFELWPSEILQKLKGADGCVWALGISAREVNKEYDSHPDVPISLD